MNINEELETIDVFFRSSVTIQLSNQSLEDNLASAISKIQKNLEEFIKNGSNWVFDKIIHLEIKAAKYQPLVGSNYIPLPKKIEAKKAVLNIQNFEDNKCLIWCLLAHKLNLGRKEHAERVSHYISHEHEIKLDDIECPVPYTKIPKIETLNNLRINIFIYNEEKEIAPLYISPREDEDVINLLLLEDEDGHQHYTLIKSFSRLMGDRTKHQRSLFYCYRCLHGFIREELLKEHTPLCQKQPVQVIKMPTEENNILHFKAVHHQHPVAYCIYADFESLIEPTNFTAPNEDTSYTIHTAKHIPCGYSYIIIGPEGTSYKPVHVYRGDNAVAHFIQSIIYEKEDLEEKIKDIQPMQLTEAEEKSFKEATICSICQKPLFGKRVRDHDHLSGRYRGAAHNHCNLNYKQPLFIPVIFHNLKHYDAHHIMTKLGLFKEYKINVIANTMEKYISFSIMKPNSNIKLVFLDSFQFLPASLEKLVNNLEPEQFNILKENFPNNTDLLLRKGVYPYEYITDFDKFEERQLPPPQAFYSSLTEEHINEDDYQHAQKVWEAFKIEDLGEYHDLYVKTDVLLLADVFENFRKLCLQYYNLDPVHSYTSPGLAWQACLKMTEIKLELFTDINMLLFIEQGVRGGVSQISTRYAKANNPETPNYNPNEPNSYIMYWDANNLYGASMSQYLPFGGFEWVDTDHITEDFILSLPDDSEDGYILEVDLDYPSHLHDLHNDYPLAPEKLNITEDMLSPTARSLFKKQKYPGSTKLTPNLQNKKNYVIHYKNLKLYLQLGLKLTAIHKALTFKQAPWLKPYIEFNTEKRKQAKTSFEKDFFKLMNNSVYGKTIENMRKHRNIELCNNELRAKKIVSSPLFKAFKIFDEDLAAAERIKGKILMNRPIYVGFSILELSKELMYNFHYNFVKKQYQERAALLFTDTDSLTYHITTSNIYEDMKLHKELFDFSDYPKNHPLFSEKNKKVIGKFKDELNSKIIFEFIGLKAKMYSILSEEGEKKRAKGVSTRIVRHKMKHQNYLDTLNQSTCSHEIQKRIAQQNHRIFTTEQNKISLSSFDDKRYMLEDKVTTLAYGHYKIKN